MSRKLKDTDHAATIMQQALKRMDHGAVKYGRFNPWADKRDLCDEIEAELLDTINYAAMLVIKVRHIKRHIPKDTIAPGRRR